MPRKVGVTIGVAGDDLIAARYKGIATRSIDFRPATRVIREILQKGLAENFASEGARFGSSWPGLSDETVRLKGSSVPLVRTGALRASLMGGPGSRSAATRTEARAGTHVWYGIFAQSGTKRGEPPRKIIGLAPQDEAKAAAVLREYLLRGIPGVPFL